MNNSWSAKWDKNRYSSTRHEKSRVSQLRAVLLRKEYAYSCYARCFRVKSTRVFRLRVMLSRKEYAYPSYARCFVRVFQLRAVLCPAVTHGSFFTRMRIYNVCTRGSKQ